MGFKDRKKEKNLPKTLEVKEEKTKPIIESGRMEKPKAKQITIDKVVEEVEKPKKVKKEITKIVVKKNIISDAVTEAKTEKLKTDYYGIGISGTHSEITKFKGLCKMQNKKVGNEIIEMLKIWNIKNY